MSLALLRPVSCYQSNSRDPVCALHKILGRRISRRVGAIRLPPDFFAARMRASWEDGLAASTGATDTQLEQACPFTTAANGVIESKCCTGEGEEARGPVYPMARWCSTPCQTLQLEEAVGRRNPRLPTVKVSIRKVRWNNAHHNPDVLLIHH